MVTIPLNKSPLRTGVISDTHGLLRPEAVQALQHVELIIHAGDIGTPDVMHALREIAPVVAVRGNMDQGGLRHALPETECIQIGTFRLNIMHDILRFYATRPNQDFDLVITGHTHRPNLTRSGRTTFLNPGSAGPKRSGLPITLATVEFKDGAFAVQHVDLESPT